MSKRRALLLFAAILALYPVSYFVVSRNAFNDPGPLGLRQGPNNSAILAPKFGYRWHPFEGLCDWDDFYDNPGEAALSTFYAPLLHLDRKWWHTEERSESGRYPVRSPLSGRTPHPHKAP